MTYKGETKKHELAPHYPPTFDYAMIAYCEDSFWKERDVLQVPAGVLRPILPRNLVQLEFQTPREVPPLDWNYVPPPIDDNPYPRYLPLVHKLWRKMQRDHFATLEAEKHMNVKDDVDPEGSL